MSWQYSQPNKGLQMSYILDKYGFLIGETPNKLKSGTEVRYAFGAAHESIDQNRTHRLVGARTGIISNAHKKYREAAIELRHERRTVTDCKLGENEFLIVAVEL